MADQQWDQLKSAVLKRAEAVSARDVFGESASDGGVYRWGVAASLGGPCDALTRLLSRLACGAAVHNGKRSSVDLAAAAESFIDASSTADPTPGEATVSVLWAAAMPRLAKRVDPRLWWDLLGALQHAREAVLAGDDPTSPEQLLIGGELGLTLAWRLADLPSCKRLGRPSTDAVENWIGGEAESIAAAVAGGSDARLVLASLIRCRKIMDATGRRKFKKRGREIAEELATWVAALTVRTGGTAYSRASRKDVRDDLAPGGLLRQAVEFDPEVLGHAISAALAESRSKGRLAWKVCLPESLLHDEDARLAVMMPEWDVRRGRVHLDYSGEDTRLEVFAGRARVLAGASQVMIEVDGEPQSPAGPWENTCEYTDDDIHYVEIEQPWSNDVVLQRQVAVLRDDRCVLIADTVITDAAKRPGETGPAEADELRPIRYTARFPLDANVDVEPQAETREVYLGDKKRRALVLPLAASEWRVGPTGAKLETSEDRHLVYHVSGAGRLYAPLWLDAQSRRFRRKRTWRQLTVGDELRIVRNDEAVGFRIQLGSEQWALYRSLGGPRCRTVMGQHLLADFVCSRFDMSDGSYEELMTVDVDESDE